MHISESLIYVVMLRDVVHSWPSSSVHVRWESLFGFEFSGKAAGAQTLELLPQGLDDCGLAVLRLAPHVLLQFFPV